MKVKVFVNWGLQEVCTEKDIEKKIKEKTEDIYEDTNEFEEFLEKELCDLTWVEVFEMATERKKEITARWKAESRDYAKEEIEDDWEEFVLEI